MLNLYEVVMEINGEIKKEVIPSTSNKTLRKSFPNAEILKIKDVTKDFAISINDLFDALAMTGCYGEVEINTILNCVKQGFAGVTE